MINKLVRSARGVKYQIKKVCYFNFFFFFIYRICASHSSRAVILRKSSSYPPINLSSLLAASVVSDRSEKSVLPTIQPNYSLSNDYLKDKRFKQSLYHPKDLSFRKNLLFDSHLTRRRSGRIHHKLRYEPLTEPSLACTFGTVITDVIANSSLQAENEGILEVNFPFKTPWPVSIYIIITILANEDKIYTMVIFRVQFWHHFRAL